MSGRELIITTVDQVLNSIFEHHMRTEIRIMQNIENWNNAYQNQDFEQMESIFAQLYEDFDMMMPLRKFLNEMGRIENLHNLIKNNGNNFDISEHERKAAELLI